MTCKRRPGATWSSCTCPTCHPLNLRARKRYSALGERHTPTRRAARAQLDQWTADGLTAEWISSATGAPFPTIYNLARYVADLPHIATSRAILTADITTATTGKRTAIGVTRRLQALAALGWTGQDIKAASGLPLPTVSGYQSGARELTTATTWHRVNDAWDALSGRRGASVRTLKRAALNGWPPPAAWDDIDDPNEQPIDKACVDPDCTKPAIAKGLCHGHYAIHIEGRAFRHRIHIDEESAADLARFGVTTTEAARRLGVQRDSLMTWLDRQGHADLAARFNRNDIAWEMAA